MSIVLVTGSGGLIGSQAAYHFVEKGYDVVGLDNDMRSYFFGRDGSTQSTTDRVRHDLGSRYEHHAVDIRDREGLQKVFRRLGTSIAAVIHAAAQPSHDWAAKEPLTDFDINAVGSVNVLEATREFAPEAAFIYCSTNKVYGDLPNHLPLVELEKRFEIDPSHQFNNGIDETMSIDASLHSVFGASKVAADVMVQEYGRYFGLRTACFRGGTLTGPAHAPAELHGFLSYLMRCVMEGRTYNLFGNKGKMVRDAIHSHDVLTAFDAFVENPRFGEIYNLGGGRQSNVSHIEAFEIAESITGRVPRINYVDDARIGDHIWYVSDMSKFRSHYPEWSMSYGIEEILGEIYEAHRDTWRFGERP